MRSKTCLNGLAHEPAPPPPVERLFKQSVHLVGSQGYADGMSQDADTGELLLSEARGSGVGKGFRRLLSDWIKRKRQPPTAGEPSGPLLAILFVIIVDQDRKRTCR